MADRQTPESCSPARLKVLGIITARGGSKGIPGKNLKLLAGKPLLAYTIDAARRSGALDRADPLDRRRGDRRRRPRRSAATCRSCGPPELARDDTPHLPVIQHAARWMQERAAISPTR